MIKKLFSIAMLLMPLSVYSGNLSCPLLKEGKSWLYIYHDFDEEDTLFIHREEELYDVSYTIQSDTVIGGVSYVKLIRRQEGTSKYYAALREEGTTLFCVYAGKTNELVLLEFDPTKFFSMSNIYCDYTERKDFVKVNDRMFIRHIYEPVEDPICFPTLRAVDGIGFRGGLVQGAYREVCGRCDYESFKACYEDGVCIFTTEDFYGPAYNKCATPTIAYDKGKLVFSCETEGAECVYEIKCTDAGGGRGGEVSLARLYEIHVHATLDGYEDSDEAVATIGWRNGQPVMEGFSSVTMEARDGNADVNGDGKVDVADIATIISVMAAQPSE